MLQLLLQRLLSLLLLIHQSATTLVTDAPTTTDTPTTVIASTTSTSNTTTDSPTTTSITTTTGASRCECSIRIVTNSLVYENNDTKKYDKRTRVYHLQCKRHT